MSWQDDLEASAVLLDAFLSVPSLSYHGERSQAYLGIDPSPVSYDAARNVAMMLYEEGARPTNVWHVFDKTDAFLWRKLLPQFDATAAKMLPSFISWEISPRI